MKLGDQVAYVPSHCNGNINDPDVEFGFVVKDHTEVCACRYWRKDFPGRLRTVANSEMTPSHLLVSYNSVPQIVVKRALWQLGLIKVMTEELDTYVDMEWEEDDDEDA